jgi:bidirectional [NiFe] hydrogenase diaphorase subunit
MLKVAEGMVVQTATPRLQAYRKMILELLLAEGNHVCAVCVANGHCQLQSLAARLGVDHVGFEYLYPQRQVDLSHPLFGLDPQRCVLCTRCVRVCDEVEGAHTWDVAGRGLQAHVITDMAQPWGESQTCTSCGKCVMACPTGALFRKGTSTGEKDEPRERLARILERRAHKQEGI